jgi:hypothetical protein
MTVQASATGVDLGGLPARGRREALQKHPQLLPLCLSQGVLDSYLLI